MSGADRITVPVRITSGQSLSAEVNVGGYRIVGIQMPAAWDAAGLALHALIAQAGSTPTFGPVNDNAGADLVLAAAPAGGDYIALPPTAALIGLGRIKVLSGTIATPVNQTATRDFFLVLVPA